MPTSSSSRVRAARFRILGPVEFFDGEHWSSINAGKQRTLLAILLLNANRVVPVQQLHADLWEDRPRERASGLLAGCVWRLRAALGDHEGAVLVTRAAGYQITVAPGELDLHEYEALVREGRNRRADADLAGALDSFNRALRMWHGTPLADVALTPSVMAETARLEESRLAVTEARIGLEIDLGRHEEVLPRLKLMVAQHPLRERLQEHLMTALYRCGQQADALGTYRDLRQLLIDELGIEPSKPLRELQQRILREDPELLIPSGAPKTASPAAATPIAVPRQLPPEPAVFVGREKELAQLTASRHAVRSVHGLVGSGKSALALRAAHAVADRFPDGQFYLNLRDRSGATPPAELVQKVSRAFGVSTVDSDSGRRVLVVLDDVPDPGPILPLLAPPPGCAVLVTGTPVTGTVDNTEHVALGRLPVAAAKEVLRQLVGAHRVDAEPDATAQIAALCEYLPLALRVAAARLAPRPDWTLTEFARRLADPRHRLDLLASGELSVRARFHAALIPLRRNTDGAAAEALGLLGFLDLPVVTESILSALLDTSRSAAHAIAERLVDAGMLESLTIDRYRVPAVVRLLATETPDVAPDPPGAVQRVVDHYVAAIRDHLAPSESTDSCSAAPSTHRCADTRFAWYREHHATLRSLALRDRTEALHKAVDELRRTLVENNRHPGHLSQDDTAIVTRISEFHSR